MPQLNKNNRAVIPVNYNELNWLNKKHKDVSLPILIFHKIDASGFYIEPQKTEFLIGERFYSLDKGLICINDTYTTKEVINSITHEW